MEVKELSKTVLREEFEAENALAWNEVSNLRKEIAELRSKLEQSIKMVNWIPSLVYLGSVGFISNGNEECVMAVTDLIDDRDLCIVSAGEIITVERHATRGLVKVCDETGGGSIGFVLHHQKVLRLPEGWRPIVKTSEGAHSDRQSEVECLAAQKLGADDAKAKYRRLDLAAADRIIGEWDSKRESFDAYDKRKMAVIRAYNGAYDGNAE